MVPDAVSPHVLIFRPSVLFALLKVFSLLLHILTVSEQGIIPRHSRLLLQGLLLSLLINVLLMAVLHLVSEPLHEPIPVRLSLIGGFIINSIKQLQLLV